MPLLLGWSGVLPFAGLSAALVAGADLPMIEASDALRGYAVIILSFMGAVHWGLALSAVAERSTPDRTEAWLYAGSVVPALAGFLALLVGWSAGLALLAVSFIALFAVDARLVRAGIAPRWYLRLRLHLTAAVVVCLGAALWAAAGP